MYEWNVAGIRAAQDAVHQAESKLWRARNVAGVVAAVDISLPPEQPPMMAPRHQANTMAWAVTQYTDIIKSRTPHRLSTNNYKRQVESLKLIGEVLDMTMPLNQVTAIEMEKLVNHFAARPIRVKTGRPLAPAEAAWVWPLDARA